jgi:hypothetical protein
MLRMVQPGQSFPRVRVGTDKDSFELVDRLGTGLDRPTLGELVHAGELQRRVARTWPGHAPALSAPPGPCSGHRAGPTCRAGDGSVRSGRAGSRRSTSWASMQRARAAPMELASDPMAHRVVGTNRTDGQNSDGAWSGTPLSRQTPRHQQRTITGQRSASGSTSSAAVRIERSGPAGSGSSCPALRVPSGV